MPFQWRVFSSTLWAPVIWNLPYFYEPAFKPLSQIVAWHNMYFHKVQTLPNRPVSQTQCFQECSHDIPNNHLLYRGTLTTYCNNISLQSHCLFDVICHHNSGRQETMCFKQPSIVQVVKMSFQMVVKIFVVSSLYVIKTIVSVHGGVIYCNPGNNNSGSSPICWKLFYFS